MKKFLIILLVIVPLALIIFSNNSTLSEIDTQNQSKDVNDFEKRIAFLKEKLETCKDETNPRLKSDCKKPVKEEIDIIEFKLKSKSHIVGPITFYYSGADVEITKLGTAILNLKMLAENTGSSENVALHCSGPLSCNYHVWDGKNEYTHSAHDFTVGNVVLKSGQDRFFNILFGPAQAYGNYVDFEYDPSKDYFLRITEPFGSKDIPLDLDKSL